MKLMKELLVKYLHSPEAILFYEKVVEFKKKVGGGQSPHQLDEHLIKLIQHIIEHHIVNGSQYEINISQRERNQLLERFKRLSGLNVLEMGSPTVGSRQSLKETQDPAVDEKSESISTFSQDNIKHMIPSLNSNSISESSTFGLVEPINLFDNALITVQRQLKEDLFPLFLRSEKFLDFCKHSSKETLGLIGYERRHSVPKGAILQNIFIEDYWKYYGSDCESLCINGYDVKFMCSLSIDSSDWTLLEQECFKKSCYTTFVSSESHCAVRADTTEHRSPNSTKLYKCTGVLNHSVHQVLRALTNSQFMATYDNNLATCECIDFQSSQVHETNSLPTSLFDLSDNIQFSSSIILQNYPFNWPLSNRDFLTSQTVLYEPSTQRYFIVIKSVNHQLGKPREGTVRSYMVGGWIVQPISEEYSRYTFVNFVDMNMCERMTQQFHLRRGKKLFHSLNKILLKERKDDSSCYSCGLMETLEEFLDLYDITIDRNQKKGLRFDMNRLIASKPINTEKIIRLTYMSRFKKTLSVEEFEKIATTATRINTGLDVTGLLLCCQEGLFYQVLEGDKDSVTLLYEKIKTDPRHYDCKIVKMEKDLNGSDRQFKSWAMNTVNLEKADHFFSDFMKDLLITVSNMELNNMTEEQAIEFIFKSSRQLLSKRRNTNSSVGSCFGI